MVAKPQNTADEKEALQVTRPLQAPKPCGGSGPWLQQIVGVVAKPQNTADEKEGGGPGGHEAPESPETL